MRAWMVYHRVDAKKNERYIRFYQEEGALRDISFEVLYVEEMEFGIQKDGLCIRYQGKEVKRPDFVVFRAIHPLLSRQIERMGIPVYNNAMVAEICNDKAKTYQYVAQLGIPMIETVFCRKDQLSDCMNRCEVGASYVFKAVAGHGGSQVFLYQKGSEQESLQKESILTGLAGNDFVMQPLTGSRHQDLRVYVIGKEIIAAVLRTANEGFKSNFSLGGAVALYQLNEIEVATVHKILDLFDFGLVGIDFLLADDGSFIFNEIEDVVGARMLYQVSDVNLVGRYLDYILSQLKG